MSDSEGRVSAPASPGTRGDTGGGSQAVGAAGDEAGNARANDGDDGHDDGGEDGDQDDDDEVEGGHGQDDNEDGDQDGGEDDGQDGDQDGDQDDDQDDDEEDDEDEEDVGSRKRRKRSGRNQFLDVEAEVDDEDEELSEDAEEVARDDGFIQSDDEQQLAAEEEARHHRRVDRDGEKFTDEDAQRLADEYREKYGRSSAPSFRRDGAVVPQRLLLPSVHDPSIFGVNCRIGKEKEAVRAILRKKLSLQNTASSIDIFSAFQRDGFPGRVYIEARNQRAVLNACKGVVNLYANSKILLVPIKEYPDMFRVRKTQETELTPGTYVRLKRGKYAGDLAVVENLAENGLEAQLRLVPRLDYGRVPVIDSAGASKRKRATAIDRPPQRLFSASDASQYDRGNLQRRGANSYAYAGDEYDHGYLVKDFKLTMLSTEGVNPNLEEITKLNASSDEGIDLQALSDSLRKDLKANTYQAGESVQITQGELANLRGKVVSSTNDIVTIVGTSDKHKGIKVSVPTEHLRKYFNVGDHVRVTGGNYKDDTGMVVQRTDEKVTLLSDVSQTEVTVFAKDLKMASDIGGSNVIGKYTLHDLVQLNAQMVGCIVDIEREGVKVLTQDGQLTKVPVSSVIMKITTGRQVATDQTGRQIEPGDTVRETTGERKQGTVLHIFHQYVFLHNREITENLGVFVNRIHNVATVSTKGARNEKGLDLSKMNPMAAAGSMAPPPVRSNMNVRRILGQKITIGGGSSYKGLKGLVKDVNDTVARIELEARNKIITVDVGKLLFKGADGRNVPFRDFMFSSRPPRDAGHGPPRPHGHGPPGGFKAPAWASGSRTPAWNSGSRTPAWNSGARTPAWNSGSRTPAWNSGSKTPAWNDGGKTPAWNADGGKTPAWNADGGKTPAWNADGGKTPAWNADGGKTPAWNADGGRTPAWNADGSRTPAWGNGARASSSWESGRAVGAPTPGVSAATPGFYDSGSTPGPVSAPTPGVYSAKTPAAVATPAAWGDDDDDDDALTKYEPQSP